MYWKLQRKLYEHINIIHYSVYRQHNSTVYATQEPVIVAFSM